MSDKEKVVALFTELGIGFTDSPTHDGQGTVILCEEGDAKIEGYTCFFTEFFFSPEGEFLSMGAGE
jgi:hypothetical protein